MFSCPAVRVVAFAAILVAASSSGAQSLSPTAAKAAAVDAYVYGYPLVTMEMTRRVMSNVAESKGTRAPMGQLVRLREYPNPSFRDVTAPNADTLYITGWIDVGAEPYVVSLPDADGRYYLFPMLDGWTNVFQVPGKRTTGTGAQTYAITGPNWKGELPEGVTQYKSPTDIVWLLGRVYCTGTKADYEAVHQLQDKIAVTPLSSYGKEYSPKPGKVDPTIDMKTPVRDQVNAMSGAEYFGLLAELMKANPPAESDAAMVAKLAQLGVVAGEPFDIGSLDPAVRDALNAAPKVGAEKILAHFKEAGKDVNGWIFTTKTGIYGDNYLQRALITYVGLGANRPQDAVYPTSQVDAQGVPYSGANKYTMTFPKGKKPPVEGFWSLTMYDADYFFVDNPLDRYTLSQRNELKTNADGSTTLYIQHESPGPEKESNWLPAPKDGFVLMMRLYWPKETSPSIIDGTWTPPAVVKVK